MSSDLSGEHKLRIVLESIIRQVPKSEQCSKYGISEEEFQSWHDHLISNGGKIFDADFGDSRTRVKKVRRMGGMAKLVLSLSLLSNLAVLLVWGIYTYIYPGSEPNPALEGNGKPADNQTASSLPVSEPVPPPEPVLPRPEEVARIPAPERSPSPSVLPDGRDDLPVKPFPLPRPNALPPVHVAEPATEISFMGRNYSGKHAVYVLDTGPYVLRDADSIRFFEKMKEELVSSIASLSPNSYFNLVLFWNLREASALGPTILRANQENKKYAIDWISSLGTQTDQLKENRNQYYPKELLYSKPLPGVVGLWYGLSTAISFDPDLLFVFAGNSPAFNLSEIPRSDFDGLGIDSRRLSRIRTNEVTVDDLVKDTARKWLISIESPSSLPPDDDSIDEIALRRLGLLDGNASIAQMIEVPWEKSFEIFLSSLEVGFERVPKTHAFVCLPQHTAWPSKLTNSAREFTESSKGSFTLNPIFP